MTGSEAITALMNGAFGLAIVAEYRGGKAEERPFRDKTTGRASSMKGAEHVLEIGNETVTWSEMLDDRMRVDTWTAPATKGSKVVVRFQLIPTDKRGTWRVRVVEILPFTESAGKTIATSTAATPKG